MSDHTMQRIHDANPFPAELPAPPIEAVWRRLEDGNRRSARRVSHGEPRERQSLAARVPRTAGVVAIGSAALAVAVVVLAIALLGHRGTNGDQGVASQPAIARSSTRALIAEVGVLRQPQTVQARDFYVSRLVKSSSGQSPSPHAIPGLTRLISLPHRGKLLLYVAPLPSQHGVYGLGYYEAYSGGGGGACCVTANALRRPVGPDSSFASGSNPHATYHQMYDEIVPDGVARVRWTFPRQPVYRDATAGSPYARPLTVSVPVHNNVAAAWLPQRGTASLDTWYAADGRVIAQHKATSPKGTSPAHYPPALNALIDHFAVFRRPQATLGKSPAVPRGLPPQAVRRYVPVTRTFGVWLTLSRSDACLDVALTAAAAPQTDAGACNSNLTDVEAGGLFVEERDIRGTTGAMFVGVAPDGTQSVTIRLANGQVETPTPRNNVFSVPEPPRAKTPFRVLRIESDSGHVTTWCPTCKVGH